MDLLIKFQQFIEKENLFHVKQRLLIAVSGGVDSMVLWYLCRQLKIRIAIVHCNFQLRGEESNEDEHFVQETANRLGDEIFIKRFDTTEFATKNKYAVQEAARILRYKWFEELLEEKADSKLDFILTAHHADDNVETMLMNFFKGTGINGLKSILPKNGKLCRPLLFSTRNEIVAYAQGNNISYREDSSNLSEKYTRNYFRHSVIPALNNVLPGVTEHLARQVEIFRDIKTIYDEYCKNILKKLIEVKHDGHYIPVLKLLKTPAYPSIVHAFATHYGFTAAQTPEIVKLLEAPSGKFISSSTHRILKNRKWLIISPIKFITQNVLIIEKEDVLVETEYFNIKIKTDGYDGTIEKNIAMAQLDAKNIEYPLLLRRWKTGDYFYPLGMKKKKKISRFLIDQKLSTLEKQETWVVESGKKIVWIVGWRIDDRFKIIPSTKDVISLQLMSK